MVLISSAISHVAFCTRLRRCSACLRKFLMMLGRRPFSRTSFSTSFAPFLDNISKAELQNSRRFWYTNTSAYKRLEKDFERIYTGEHLVYVFLIYFLAERVAVVNVRELLQHFANLLGKVNISG